MPIDKELSDIIESNEPLESVLERLHKLLKSNPKINLNETYSTEPRVGHTLFSWLVVNNKIQLAQALFNMGAATNIYPKGLVLTTVLDNLLENESTAGKNHEEQKQAIIHLKNDIHFAELNPNRFATALAFVPYKSTELMAHLVSENYGVVKSMIANHLNTINPNIKDKQGKTVLCLAVKMNRTDIVEYLLRMLPGKIDVNTQDNEGNTPLHYAFAYGNREMITALLSHGASHQLTNRQGLKPEQMVSISKEAVISLLDSVAINAHRDVNANFNDPPFYMPGKSMMDDDENAVNSWEYLEAVLKKIENKDIQEAILQLKKNYAGISMIADIMKNKADPKPLLELLRTIKPIVQVAQPETAASEMASSTVRSEPLLHSFKNEIEIEFPEAEEDNIVESAVDLVSSALYGQDIKIIKDTNDEEALEFRVANEKDLVLFVEQHHAIVQNLENLIIQIPKKAVIALLQEDNLETCNGKPIWEALKEELNVSARLKQ